MKAAHAAHCLMETSDVISSFEVHSVERLQHEIKVYTSLLADIAKFLDSRKNPRARFLLNIPSLVKKTYQVQLVKGMIQFFLL